MIQLTPFLLLVFQILISSSISLAQTRLCPRDQSTALLQFRQAITVDASASQECEGNGQIPSPKTASWNRSTDCCRWDGVTCDDLTGQVIQLDLSCSQIQGVVDSNSSLFQLSRLQRLNLAYNDFSGSKISSNFGVFSSLTHLNMSSSGFSGQLPSQFLRLSNLISLDLSSDFQNIQIDSPIFRLLLQNLTHLREVSLRSTEIPSVVPSNISASIAFLNLANTLLHGRLPDDIFNLPNLQSLVMTSNLKLTGQLLKIKQNSSLRYLDLSGTSFSGKIPESIGNLKLLNYLDLSSCNFWGSIPESLGNLTQINNLILLSNNFTGTLPSTLSSLDQLIRLDLSNNALQGQIPNYFDNFTELTDLSLRNNLFTGSFPSSVTNLKKLESLDSSYNSLTGPIPPVVSGLLNLTFLLLADNSFNGTIPSWVFGLPSLQYLGLRSNGFTGQIHEFRSQSLVYIYLSGNKMYGPIPKSLSKQKNMTTLYLSSNNFSGEVDISIFSNMKQLKVLGLSSNSLSLTNNDANTTLPASLETLYLSSCGITNIDFLRGVKYMVRLDLSNNLIAGKIPEWMDNNWSEYIFYVNFSNNLLTSANQLLLQNLVFLDLSSNLLQGPIFVPPATIMVFFISNNNLTGEIPLSMCKLSSLDVLDLSNNSLSGVIPLCLGNASSKLSVLDMHMNRFRGQIPGIFGVGSNLRSLNLRNNQLEGTVPRSLSNCKELEVLDLGNNNLNGTFPSWLGSLPKLQVLSLRCNSFFGPLSASTRGVPFSALRIIDLSHNEFTGILPARFFRNLRGMVRVDKSPSTMYLGGDYYQDTVVVVVKGLEIQLVRILSVFTTVDISGNIFEGMIPDEIGGLLSLRGLNLSHNNIRGRIPLVLGNITVLESLDLSSNQLDGEIPRQLTALTSLAVLNLSENNLVGSIPLSNQFATFENDSYIGNPGLCGFPLSKLCGDNGSPPLPPPLTFDEKNKFFNGFTWESVLIGYSCGMMIGVFAACVIFYTGKPRQFNKFIRLQGLRMKRKRRKEIKWLHTKLHDSRQAVVYLHNNSK